MPEIRVLPEGTLRWMQQASGSGYQTQTSAPYTASGAASNLIGFVQEGMSLQQKRQITPIYNRGLPSHFKQSQLDAGQLSFQVAWGITGDYPPTATAAAASSTLPLLFMEWKSTAPEAGAAIYHQFYNCTWMDAQKITERAKGNEDAMSFFFTHMVGPTASGYLG